MANIIIAIDGPAATGKGTIARRLAQFYGAEYIDTGIFYRCAAYLVDKLNISLDEEEKIIEITKNMNIIIKRFDVYLDDVLVTDEIRSNNVNAIVSQVSAIKEVRLIVNEHIRDFAFNKNCVVDGRDITTVVFPNAKFKFYLDCDVDERARRRFNQNQEMGIECTFESIYENLKMRDYNDKTKEFGALTLASDATLINTTNDAIEETIEKLKDIIGSELK